MLSPALSPPATARTPLRVPSNLGTNLTLSPGSDLSLCPTAQPLKASRSPNFYSNCGLKLCPWPSPCPPRMLPPVAPQVDLQPSLGCPSLADAYCPVSPAWALQEANQEVGYRCCSSSSTWLIYSRIFFFLLLILFFPPPPPQGSLRRWICNRKAQVRCANTKELKSVPLERRLLPFLLSSLESQVG